MLPPPPPHPPFWSHPINNNQHEFIQPEEASTLVTFSWSNSFEGRFKNSFSLNSCKKNWILFHCGPNIPPKILICTNSADYTWGSFHTRNIFYLPNTFFRSWVFFLYIFLYQNSNTIVTQPYLWELWFEQTRIYTIWG